MGEGLDIRLDVFAVFEGGSHFFERIAEGSGFRGEIYSYENLVKSVRRGQTKADALDPSCCIRTAMLKWDNTARRGADAHIWENFNHKHYERWLRHLIRLERRKTDPEEKMIFINAWNEWAEGTCLEPSERLGYKSLNTTSRALYT